MCLCRDQVEINLVNAEKNKLKEAQKQKDQMERQKKENELRKNFQVIFFFKKNQLKCYSQAKKGFFFSDLTLKSKSSRMLKIKVLHLKKM